MVKCYPYPIGPPHPPLGHTKRITTLGRDGLRGARLPHPIRPADTASHRNNAAGVVIMSSCDIILCISLQPPDNTKTADHQMVAATYWPHPYETVMVTHMFSTTYKTKLSILHRRPMRETTAKIASKGTFRTKIQAIFCVRKKFCRNIAKIRPLVDENYRITRRKDSFRNMITI